MKHGVCILNAVARKSGIYVIILLLIFVCTDLSAQHIINQDSPERTFVYEISNREAEKLLRSKPQDSVMLKMLHTPVASFHETWDDKPEKGHFILVNIHKNRVYYRYMPVMPFQVFLFKEYGNLTLQVVDSEGNIRDNAKVRIKGAWRLFDTGISFDKTSKTYTINDQSENTDRLLTVGLDGFTVMFNLKTHLVSPRYGGEYNDDYKPNFYSYMITDKNRYKPGETVRFKSYALSQKRKPLMEVLSVWVNDRKIKDISPYNSGGYADEVLLHDSLKLRLDQNYSIYVTNKRGLRIASTAFRYEDYELYDSRIETKLDSINHYDPNINRLEIKTLDANGLPLLDMKAEIRVVRNNVSASFADLLILPDTLMFQTIDLDNSEPTLVDIPPSIFGESNCSYTVYVKAYTYDNQVLTSTNSAVFYKSRYNIEYSTRNDTICFDFEETGIKKQVKAKLWYDDRRDYKEIGLPYEEPFRQSVDKYNIQIEEPNFVFSVNSSVIEPELDVKGGIMADSFNIQLVNPLNLDISWYVYQGDILIEKGSGKEFDFKYPNTNLEVAHYVEFFYHLGNRENVFRRTFIPETEFLVVDIDLPERVYPGQTLNAIVTVKDNMGKPVKGVDLTAFAYNSQLGYKVRDLDYYGPSPKYREQRASYSLQERNASDFNVPLDYPRWKTIAGLDTMMYYNFSYPRGKMFWHEVSTPDSTTQFAPFVMKNGESVQAYVIELNAEPVYFSWTDQPKGYSFVAPLDLPRQKITLRLHDRLIIIDSIRFTPRKKTILSIDLDSLPSEKVRTVMINNLKSVYQYGNQYGMLKKPRVILYGELMEQEKRQYIDYISRIPVRENGDYTYLRDTFLNITYPVYHYWLQPRVDNVLAGPFSGMKRLVQYCDGIVYKHEGGFRYEYDGNVVYKYDANVFPEQLTFFSTTDFSRINDFSLTPKVLWQLVESRKAEAGNWSPTSIKFIHNGLNLSFNLPENQDTTGVSNLLLRDVYTDSVLFTRSMIAEQREHSQIPASTYDAVLLYNSGRYIRFDSIAIGPYKYIEVNMANRPLNEKDSLSKKWLELKSNIFYPLYLKNVQSYYEQPNYTRQREVGGTYTFLRTGSSSNIIRGTVIDETGEAVIGANIVEKGTTNGTLTNLDGNFEINVSGTGATLVFSYIGYKHLEIWAQRGSIVSVIMEESRQFLEEIVVIGYGTQRKASLTGAVSSVSSFDRAAEAPSEKPEDRGEVAERETREAEERLYSELLQLNGLRSNFSDVGFWEPRLVTDKKGESRFSVTFPDNITQWNTIVYAMNRRLKTGVARKYIRSYKPLMAELKNPQFLVSGDTSYFAGNIRNYTYGNQDIKGRVMFAVGQDTVMRKDIDFTSTHQDMMLVSADATDSLTTTYLFRRDDGYSDGERRTIPVIRQGTEVAEGELGFLSNGDRKEVSAASGEEVNIIIAAKQLDIYMDAVYYLHGYRFDCNEQLASKLIGLLNYKIYAQYSGEKFKYDSNVRKIIRRLTGNRNSDKLWSWWGSSSATSFWMSAHVIRALNMAQKAGYVVDVNFREIEQDYTDMSSFRSSSLYDLDIISSLSEAESVQNYSDIIDFMENEIGKYEYFTDSITRVNKLTYTTSYLKEKMQLLELRQQHGIGYTADSLTKYLKKDVLGAVYCDDGKQQLWWYNNNMVSTLIAYRIAKKDSTLHHLIEPMRMYILGTKRYGWNTYQASSAVMTILPDLIAESSTKETPASVLLSGKENKQITKFPFETTLAEGESLKIEKRSGMPLIYSAYKMKYVTEENTGEAFGIETKLDAGDTITAGVPVTLEVTVTVKRKNAEYVMIEVPIPAGCGYNSKSQLFSRKWGWHETYRESFKDRTVIFCENLPQGTYTFNIELLPRYTGRYSLNPAKVEMMYFPVINSNNSLRGVDIKNRD